MPGGDACWGRTEKNWGLEALMGGQNSPGKEHLSRALREASEPPLWVVEGEGRLA